MSASSTDQVNSRILRRNYIPTHAGTRLAGLTLLVFAIALAMNLGVGGALGLRAPMQSDASYFLDLASHLADGRGYATSLSFWPDTPSVRRLPGWPFLVGAGLKLMPGAAPELVMRALALAVNAGAAALLTLLTGLLFRRTLAAAVAGLAYMLHPAALHCAYAGLSEPLFIFLAVLGAILLLRPGGASGLYAGCLVLGLACLVRANFAAWMFFAGVCWFFTRRRARRVPARHEALAGLTAAVIFLAPLGAWTVRNYKVCGHFPVISALGGQTFYGGNNPVVASDLDVWGYWIFPNAIPGETPMAELAHEMSEAEVDAYYAEKGRRYIAGHLPGMPRLLLGKLVRAYIPLPWKPSWRGYAVGLFRLLLYALAVLGLRRTWSGTPFAYRIMLAAVLLANVLTVLVFYGYTRFAFIMEPFLLPYAGVTAASVFGRCRRRKPETSQNTGVDKTGPGGTAWMS